MTKSAWDPTQYDRFADERRQPFFDLVDLVEPRPHMRIVDLGCGTGELTRILHDRLAATATLGVDSSGTMLAGSAQYGGSGVEFVRADIAEFEPEFPVDLAFSNAALHWVDDHGPLFARLAAWLEDGGQLAVQMPTNFDHPSHVIAGELAGQEPFRSELDGWSRRWPLLPPEWYEARLFDLGFAHRHVRVQVYGHELDSRADVLEWVKGTLLTPYRERMSADVYDEFLARYQELLMPALDNRRPHLYPFKRILIWAARP